MIVASEIGVSITRAAPNFCCSPRYWPKIPPRPTSSPSATTRASAAIARSSAAHAACA
jgi:hypothetical protein